MDVTLAVFRKDPFQSSLRNHELKGKLAGKRSISAGHDLRITLPKEFQAKSAQVNGKPITEIKTESHGLRVNFTPTKTGKVIWSVQF